MSNHLKPNSPNEICDWMKSNPSSSIQPVGGRSKSALSARPNDAVIQVDMTGISGIIDYQPADFTISVRAGTMVSEVQQALAEHGQFLPFDPPMIHCGATIGGMIASGWNGSCRLLWGGIRDFVLAVDFIDGTGRLVRAGAAVVKNTAGYDLPKFFVGSCGQFGIMTSACLKVFPKPHDYQTLAIETRDLPAAIRIMSLVQSQPMSVVAMDLIGNRLHVRLAGDTRSIEATRDRIQQSVKNDTTGIETWDDDSAFWISRSHPTTNLSESTLVKVVCSRSSLPGLDRHLNALGLSPAYCHAGNSCLVEVPNGDGTATSMMDRMDRSLAELHLQGMTLLSHQPVRLLGDIAAREFMRRAQKGLDPDHRFAHSFVGQA
jgi:glycolate oxidase FAD binding subunit